MNKTTFALMVLVFVSGLLGRNLWSCAAGTFRMGKNRRRDENTSVGADKKVEKSFDDRDFLVLGKMGYFLASNDDGNTFSYSPTPFQDINPRDLA